MSQPAFDFTVPNAYARRGPVQARHASRLGAESAAGRAETQTARYIALLQSYPDGLTDWRAAELLGIERTSVNARRSPLVKTGVVVANGFHKDDHSDVVNTRWQLAAMRKRSTSPCSAQGKDESALSSGTIKGAVNADVAALGVTSPGGENPASESHRGTGQPGHRKTSDASGTEHVAMLPSAPPSSPRRLTAETVSGVAYGTRVRLVDGAFGQARMVMRNGDLAVVVRAGELRWLKPDRLIDRRETEDELVEIEEGNDA